MGRSVTKRKDGHFSVSGQPSDVYYGDERTAKRVAANLDKADQERKTGQPAAPPKNQNQRARAAAKQNPAPAPAPDNGDDDDAGDDENTDE